MQQYRKRCMSTSPLCGRLRVVFSVVQLYRKRCMSISPLCGRLRVLFSAVQLYRKRCMSVLPLCGRLRVLFSAVQLYRKRCVSSRSRTKGIPCAFIYFCYLGSSLSDLVFSWGPFDPLWAPFGVLGFSGRTLGGCGGTLGGAGRAKNYIHKLPINRPSGRYVIGYAIC